MIDTNVLISAILKDRLPEKVISYVLENENFIWVASEDIIDEYKTVIARPKFNLPIHEIEKQYNLIDRKVKNIRTSVHFEFPKDIKDSKFLSCAIASGAGYFITGDRDFSVLDNFPHTKILSVPQFAEIMKIE